uniref:Uncharacterized protein n=1 Tax=Sphaerodactylus townsendi TaxID=933632 RepID=A0ACB8EEZ2_9SAUR
MQTKSECRLANGTAGQVRFLDRLIWDRQEFVRFDSRRGTFEGVTELGEPLARDFNSHKETLDVYRTAVDVFCRHNWGVFRLLQRQEEKAGVGEGGERIWLHPSTHRRGAPGLWDDNQP